MSGVEDTPGLLDQVWGVQVKIKEKYIGKNFSFSKTSVYLCSISKLLLTMFMRY